ncbi:MAG: hypothetical protein KIT28_15535 [Rubrivivax sp.]|nr:hypothetical protein [Rubrivivax sp.]HOW49579.1 hypothetical protein [Rubrivivax sp.]HRY88841.1 hypothetical protein [Rubrivivax sp.]
MQSRRDVLMAASLTATALASLPAQVAAADAQVQLMFVQSADSLKADDTMLRLVNVPRQAIWFSDRPVRQAGHLRLRDFLKEWTTAAGPNNFSQDPPNATLSVYQPGKDENTLTVVEISEPKVDGKDLVYRYKLLEGQMPKSGTAASLFIDWIGVGGGVGPGFHGVGVGRRGVGWR